MDELSGKLSRPELHEVRRSARTATLLTLVSGLVVLGSLVYGAFQIRSLDTALADRHKQIDGLDRDIAAKKTALQGLETRVSDLNAVVAAIPPEQVKQALSNPSVDTSSLPARVYIHIAREDQRQAAEKAAASLRTAGFIVPGIEYVGNKAPNPSQVRYFQRADESGSDLPRIVQTLHAAGVQANGQYVSLPSSTARPRHFELWFGKDA